MIDEHTAERLSWICGSLPELVRLAAALAVAREEFERSME